jgi:hypothetical protein
VSCFHQVLPMTLPTKPSFSFLQGVGWKVPIVTCSRGLPRG